jgi:3alpha(or 20beta)-hydroxysteroid dehydrogenase
MRSPSADRGRLAGKVVLITGAAGGQGAAEARLFAAEGATVVIGDVRDDAGEATASEIGGAARYRHLDVGDEASWPDVMAWISATHGRLDVLLNNAGTNHVRTLAEETMSGFLRVLQVNLVGVFLGIRAATPLLRRVGGGSIVNVASTAALTGFAGLGAYCASKWGVRGLSRTAALELGPDGIRVNVINPGPIETAMLSPEIGRRLSAELPVGRIGRPDDVAELALYLASDASSFMTGSELTIDGGMLAGRRLDR